MSSIVVRRDGENDIKMRGLMVFLDGEYVWNDISFNASYTAEVSAGTHTVKVSNHLYSKSVELQVKEDETIELLAGNSFTLTGGMMVAVLGMGPYRVFLEEKSRRGQTPQRAGA